MRYWLLTLLSFVTVLIHVAACPATAKGQAQQLPHRGYYAGFAPLYEGEYRTALRRFNSEYRTALQIRNARFVDSVCILTMIGECYFRVGDYQTALQRYNDALDLYATLDSQQWQSNITLINNIPPDTGAIQRARVTWGTSKRNSQIANVPDTFTVVQPQLGQLQQLDSGNLLQTTEARQVNVTEVLRCVALAIHRRRIISGPTSRYSPAAIRLAGSLRKAGVGSGTMLGTYNGVAYGMAMSAIGEHDKAAAALSSSLQLQGGMDHPLTPLALAELAHIGVVKQKPSIALNFAMEATYAGAYLEQPDVVEEGFSLATQAHLLTSRTPLPSLRPAITWAARERTQMLETSLNVNLAECFAEAGDVAQSKQSLNQANKLMTNRNNIAQTLLTGKLRYLTAVNEFTVGDTRGGLSSLKAAMKELTAKSPAIFRLQLADSLAVNQSLTEKQIDLLYTKLLQDPAKELWQTEPMDAIAFLLTPHVEAMERWLEILIQRKQIDRAVEVADQIRRHRFYADLPLGGRLLSLRWVLQGDAKFLKPDALKQRQALLTKYSGYRDLLNQSTLLQNKLDGLPLQPADKSDEKRTQRETMAELAKIHQRQEGMIASMALRREPAEMAFPPIGNSSDIKEFVSDGQIIFSVLQTSAGYHIFFFDSQRARYLGLVDARKLKSGVGSMLSKMGVAANYANSEVLASDDWKQSVEEFQTNLFEDISDDQLAATQELIVIPDGLLWYVPFEAFLVGADQRPLIETTKVRYAPTLFLALANPSSDGAVKSTGVVTGAMYPKTDPAVADEVFTEVLEKEIDAKNLAANQDLPSDQVAGRLDQLVVLGKTPLKNGAFNLQPLHSDSSRKNSKDQATLLDWMKVPFFAPSHVVLAGLNSIGGADGLSRPDGRELFFTATSVMAAGGRSVALSRWNTGGKTQAELAAKYARYSVAMPVTTALQKAVKYVQSSKVDLNKEPRVKSDPQSPAADGDSPFFWSGLMVVSYADNRTADPAVLAMADKPADVKDAAVPPKVDPANPADPANPVDPQEMPNVTIQPPPPEQDNTATVADTPPESDDNLVGMVDDKVVDKEGSSTKATDDDEDGDEDDDEDEGGAIWKIGGKK